MWYSINHSETWLSGLKRIFAKDVRVYSPSEVRILSSPLVENTALERLFS